VRSCRGIMTNARYTRAAPRDLGRVRTLPGDFRLRTRDASPHPPPLVLDDSFGRSAANEKRGILVAAAALEQSMLESKDKDTLLEMAKALGVKVNARLKKSDIIDKILDTTGSVRRRLRRRRPESTSDQWRRVGASAPSTACRRAPARRLRPSLDEPAGRIGGSNASLCCRHGAPRSSSVPTVSPSPTGRSNSPAAVDPATSNAQMRCPSSATSSQGGRNDRDEPKRNDGGRTDQKRNDRTDQQRSDSSATTRPQRSAGRRAQRAQAPIRSEPQRPTGWRSAAIAAIKQQRAGRRQPSPSSPSQGSRRPGRARRARTSSSSTRTHGFESTEPIDGRGLPRPARRGLRLPARQRLPAEQATTSTSRSSRPGSSGCARATTSPASQPSSPAATRRTRRCCASTR
jgi:hypothetical protein